LKGIMKFLLPKYRNWLAGSALLVSLHLAWLPLFATAHEASHAIANAALADGDPILRCPGGEPASHRYHFDRERVAAADLNCDLCVFFQHAIGKKASVGRSADCAATQTGAPLPPLPDHKQAFLSIDRPRGRSPPSSL
jgi:hypothetical protein